MTDTAAKVEVQHLVAARETIAFLRDIDWGASSEDWKYARVAEIIARHAPAPEPDLTIHLAKYRDAMDAIYNDSEAGRELVTKHFGLTHPVVEPDAPAPEWEQAELRTTLEQIEARVNEVWENNELGRADYIDVRWLRPLLDKALRRPLPREREK